jgi:hypothetical protein
MVPVETLVRIIVIACALGGALLLLVAAIDHIRHFDRLRAALVAQRLVPYRWHRRVGVALVVAELAVGGAVGAVVLVVPSWSGPVFIAEAVTYGGFLGYLLVLRIRRPATPCGCFGDDGPVGVPALLRAGTLALGAGAAALPGGGRDGDAGAALLILAAACVIAVLARVVPALYPVRED